MSLKTLSAMGTIVIDMKTNSRRALALVAVSASWVVGLFSSNVQGQTQIQGQAMVRFTAGVVSYSSKGGPFVPLRVNTALTSGDVIKTGDNAKVDLFLGRNNGAVQVAPNTVLALDRLTYSTGGEEVVHDTEMDLQQGRIYGRVSKMSAQSRYEVKTPRFVAGIRGTQYTISADGLVTVTEGSVLVVVATPSPQPGQPPVIQTFRVDAGNTFDVKAAAGQEVRPATPAETQQLNQQLQQAFRQATDQNLTPIQFVAPGVFTPPASAGGAPSPAQPPTDPPLPAIPPAENKPLTPSPSS